MVCNLSQNKPLYACLENMWINKQDLQKFIFTRFDTILHFRLISSFNDLIVGAGSLLFKKNLKQFILSIHFDNAVRRQSSSELYDTYMIYYWWTLSTVVHFVILLSTFTVWSWSDIQDWLNWIFFKKWFLIVFYSKVLMLFILVIIVNFY